ncbi:unnamed protein product [Bursaphelenchus xylophilus]|uniref:(pine wood nematode) hypothetical protein n=1 Tax=Bursaphelenchus xylophilus TaxID=6326 RepID=A0A7I8WG89_BURXY|nr:unnamed protein product [Bursaphelenchus xylophilus]CAG9111269.1 unnamed protein product [Bursaphelenchus xylophilus]
MPFAPIHQHFEKAVKFVYQHRVEKRGILIHCFMGVSRSVTIMLAYIVTVLDMEVPKALRFVKQRRYCAEPNFGFKEQLCDYVKSHRNNVRNQLIEMHGEKKFKEIVDAEKKFVKKHS